MQSQTLTRRRFTLLTLLAAAALLGVHRTAMAAPDETPKPKTVRLLTVGNSFSNNATRYLPDLAKADGNTLVHRACSVGGSSMELHWGKAEAHEKDPADAKGLYASKKGLKQELAAEPWDFVTIQQASIKSHDVETYRPFAKQLHDYIKAHAPKSEVLIHQTWAYRVDDPRFGPRKTPAPEGEPVTRQQMHDMLTNAYKTIAAELKVRRIPVGDAFNIAETDPTWAYKPDAAFDFKAAMPPALPNQAHSLHTGWYWPKGTEGASKIGMDGHHANAAGQYLAACVWYEVLFGASPVGNKFVPPGIEPAYAKFLQETAHRAVIESNK